jgi:hypothetical protein
MAIVIAGVAPILAAGCLLFAGAGGLQRMRLSLEGAYR